MNDMIQRQTLQAEALVTVLLEDTSIRTSHSPKYCYWNRKGKRRLKIMHVTITDLKRLLPHGQICQVN